MEFMTFQKQLGNGKIPTDELTPSFFRGVGQPPTRLLLTIINHIIITIIINHIPTIITIITMISPILRVAAIDIGGGYQVNMFQLRSSVTSDFPDTWADGPYLHGQRYPPVNIEKTMERSTIFNG